MGCQVGGTVVGGRKRQAGLARCLVQDYSQSNPKHQAEAATSPEYQHSTSVYFPGLGSILFSQFNGHVGLEKKQLFLGDRSCTGHGYVASTLATLPPEGQWVKHTRHPTYPSPDPSQGTPCLAKCMDCGTPRMEAPGTCSTLDAIGLMREALSDCMGGHGHWVRRRDKRCTINLNTSTNLSSENKRNCPESGAKA